MVSKEEQKCSMYVPHHQHMVKYPTMGYFIIKDVFVTIMSEGNYKSEGFEGCRNRYYNSIAARVKHVVTSDELISLDWHTCDYFGRLMTNV